MGLEGFEVFRKGVEQLRARLLRLGSGRDQFQAETDRFERGETFAPRLAAQAAI